MLHAVFRNHEAFIILAVLVCVTLGYFGYKVASTSSDRPIIFGLLTASVTGVICLTMWSTGSGSGKPQACLVNRDLLEPFTTEQGILNAGLFIPVGLLGVLATGRVLGPLLGGFLLTFAIETVQGLLTFLGRGCDTSDLQMNFIGVAVGAFCGWAVLRFEGQKQRHFGPSGRKNAIAAVVSLAALSLAWAFLLSPEYVDRTVGIGRADSTQEGAMVQAVQQAFEGHYEIRSVQFAAGPKGTGTVLAAFDEGFAELSWPDRRKFSASLDISDAGKPSGYPIPGNQTHPKNEREAQQIASDYAQKHAPWGIQDAQRSISPVGDKAQLGWITSWRRRNADGVLMPMRLDIQIDRTGRLSQLIMLNAPDPSIDTPSVANKDAISAVLERVDTETPADPKNFTTELLARESDSQWHPYWLVSGQYSGGNVSGVVDAVTGRVLEFNHSP